MNVGEDEPMSLQELSPSPVEETPASTDGKGHEYFPKDSSSSMSNSGSSSSSSFLGLSSRRITQTLQLTQRYSSYTFTIFVAFHLTNTSIIPLLTRSLPEADKYLLLTRPYYQSAIAEPFIVILPALAHVASGLLLRLHRRRVLVRNYSDKSTSRAEKRSIPWPQLSGTSVLGYLLVGFVGGHAYLNRFGPLLVDGGAASSSIGLEYVGHGFAHAPVFANATFAVLVAATAWHITWGGARWLGFTPEKVFTGTEREREREKSIKWWVLNVMSAVVAGVWMAGGLGVVGQAGKVGGYLGREYDRIYEAIPLIGSYLV